METYIDELIRDGYLKTPAIIHAFRTVSRADFLPEAEKDSANLNIPLPIGYGQTNSQPLTVAFMLELLQPKPGDRVLDVGAGSGWTAALLAAIVGSRGRVRAVERIPQLYRFAEENLKKYHFSNLMLVRGDATEPDPEMPEYDVIHIAAAAPEVPSTLRRQCSTSCSTPPPPWGEKHRPWFFSRARMKKSISNVVFQDFLLSPYSKGESHEGGHSRRRRGNAAVAAFASVPAKTIFVAAR